MSVHFKLQKLLHYRETMKSLACEELARRVQSLNAARDELERLKAEERELLQSYSVQTGKVDTGLINLYHDYFHMLQGSCAVKEKEIAGTQARVEHQRDEVLHAWQELRKLEILQEKERQSRRAQEKAEEQKLSDEISISRYAAGGSGRGRAMIKGINAFL